MIRINVAQFKYTNGFKTEPKLSIIDYRIINKNKTHYSLLVILCFNIIFGLNHNLWKTHY